MIERKFLVNNSYNYLGDYMKHLFKIVKKLCLGIFSIYSVNVLFSLVNIIIPINIYTLLIVSTLKIPGACMILIYNLVLYK